MMSTIVDKNVVKALADTLPIGGKSMLARRLNVSHNAVALWFKGKRGMKKEYFDECVKMIREYNQFQDDYKKIVAKLNKN